MEDRTRWKQVAEKCAFIEGKCGGAAIHRANRIAYFT
jgi:hypothetical protein